MICRAPTSKIEDVESLPQTRRSRRSFVRAFTALSIVVGLTPGCADRGRETDADREQQPESAVVVVAPVLNLSGSSEFDPQKVTDILASELASVPGIFVIPTNRSRAALAVGGRRGVSTPQEAVELAEMFDADGCVLMSVTEFSPYDPPTIGVILQWYVAKHDRAAEGAVDPSLASREAVELAGQAQELPWTAVFQMQRVFRAIDEEVKDDIRDYAEDRDEHNSPYGWRVHVASQELFVRYSCWAAIRSIKREMSRARTQHGTQDGRAPA